MTPAERAKQKRMKRFEEADRKLASRQKLRTWMSLQICSKFKIKLDSLAL
jgi:hypothetical protein